jgi:hypothetical protein
VDPVEEYLSEVWPTVEVQPFIGTRKRYLLGNEIRRGFVPMVPFGFFVRHEGPLLGFVISLTATGAPGAPPPKDPDISFDGLAIQRTRLEGLVFSIAAVEPGLRKSLTTSPGAPSESAACALDFRRRTPNERATPWLALLVVLLCRRSGPNSTSPPFRC